MRPNDLKLAGYSLARHNYQDEPLFGPCVHCKAETFHWENYIGWLCGPCRVKITKPERESTMTTRYIQKIASNLLRLTNDADVAREIVLGWVRPDSVSVNDAGYIDAKDVEPVLRSWNGMRKQQREND